MSETGGGANGVWKWIAAILVAVLLAGAPAIVMAVRAPTNEEVDLIHERQLQMLVKLSQLEEQLSNLERELEEHEAGDS